MYNQLVKELLSKVIKQDAAVEKSQIKYEVKDNFSYLKIYISEEKISFKVSGDAYILAMMKWLQIQFEKNIDLKDIGLEMLVSKFDLPEVKYRNALQIIELIEKVYEGSTL